MKLKNIKYFWNYVSILIIVLSAEVLFHIEKNKYEKKFTKTNIVSITYKCNVEVEYYRLGVFNYCDHQFTTLRSPIKKYFDEVAGQSYLFQNSFRYETNPTYTLIRFKLKREFTDNDLENFKLYLKKFEQQILVDYLELKIYDFKNSFLENLFHRNNKNSINSYWKTFFSKADGEDNLLKKRIENLVSENLSALEDRINLYREAGKKDVGSELVVSQEFEVEIIKDKFYRLSYINIFIVSLIFAIFINVIVALSFELKNNFKKRLDD
ncbi:hypothetical protein N9O63_00045 [Candidatus Pelagibacter sp.]|nr:hypothetical protein [Candidatus Pelagibacter sp.]|tara:strand:+ start:130 stop:930 length:801 start_codon:yes stop_codon:yes gene_type:complete